MKKVCATRVSVWCIVAASVWVPAAAFSQSVMSEAGALARLSADSARVRALRAGIEIARADTLAVARWPNPRLNVGREAVAGVSETMTTVLQPLPITGQRRFDMASASSMVEAAESRANDAVRRARADLRMAYAELVAAQIRERELTGAGERLQSLVDILDRRERAGDAAGFDRLRAQREVMDVEADRALAAADRAMAQGRLASYFVPGTDPSAIVVEEPTVGPRDLPPLGVLVEQAARTRGEALALQQEIESARFAVRAADRRRFPELEVLGGTKSSSLGGGDIGGVVGIQAVLPLFDRGAPERARAQARGSAAAARLEMFRVALAGEIASWRGAALERRRAAERYRASALSVGDVPRIAQVSYEAGERGILELLDAYRTAASVRLRQSALDATARAAEIELEFVSGWEVP